MDEVSRFPRQELPPGERRILLLANPRGFCAGVNRAIETVERALEEHGPPVYVRRAIVHNRSVIERLERLGAVFVQELREVPEGSIAILSAHGSARSVKSEAQAAKLRFVDAICPLVAKIHGEVESWYHAGRHVLLIGHQGHPEIVGTLGQLPAGAISVVSRPEDVATLGLASNTAVAYAIQTTFSVRDAEEMVAEIQSRFADVAGPRSSDICYATTNRQQAAETIAQEADLFLVVGDEMSSNARRLVEVAMAAGCARTRLVHGVDDLPWDLINEAKTVGLTAAASAPEFAINDICAALASRGFVQKEIAGKAERVSFRPVALHPLAKQGSGETIPERLVRLKADVEAVLESAVGNGEGRDRRLAEAMRYAVLGGGKRFRAMLALAVSELVGGDYRKALRVGAAIECVHAQSLVHDDLPCMDDDDFRRGKSTLHRKFDEATAVLAGDALLALAFEILAHEDTHPDPAVRARLVLALSRAIGQDGLASGQMMDLYPPDSPTDLHVFECESKKTGSLIRYAVEAASMLGRCSADELVSLLRFAENLGLVFQIRDDMLDNMGDPNVVGKALNKDAMSGRVSATVLMGIDGAARESGKLEVACYEALSNFGEQATSLRNLTRFAVSRMH